MVLFLLLMVLSAFLRSLNRELPSSEACGPALERAWRLRASFEAAPCRACASRALALRGDGLVDSMSSVAGLKKPMPRAF